MGQAHCSPTFNKQNYSLNKRFASSLTVWWCTGFRFVVKLNNLNHFVGKIICRQNLKRSEGWHCHISADRAFFVLSIRICPILCQAVKTEAVTACEHSGIIEYISTYRTGHTVLGVLNNSLHFLWGIKKLKSHSQSIWPCDRQVRLPIKHQMLCLFVPILSRTLFIGIDAQPSETF